MNYKNITSGEEKREIEINLDVPNPHLATVPQGLTELTACGSAARGGALPGGPLAPPRPPSVPHTPARLAPTSGNTTPTAPTTTRMFVSQQQIHKMLSDCCFFCFTNQRLVHFISGIIEVLYFVLLAFTYIPSDVLHHTCLTQWPHHTNTRHSSATLYNISTQMSSSALNDSHS